jgi:hypothetical protein
MPDSGTAAKLLRNNKLADRLAETRGNTWFHRLLAAVYCFAAPKYQGFWGVLLVALLATMFPSGLLSGGEPEPNRSVPDLDDLWAGAERQTPAVAKASVQTQRWQRPLTEIPIKDSRDSGRYPVDLSTEIPAAAGENAGVGALRQPWSASRLEWAAAELVHQPLYFDDEPLERYGQSVCPLVQPVCSAARFFGTLPILPYKVGLDHPYDCVSTLGYYRIGTCAPCTHQTLPFSWKGALLEGGTWVGLIFLLP